MVKGQTTRGKPNKRTWTAKDWHDNGYKESHFQTWLLKEFEKLRQADAPLYVVKVMKGNSMGIPDLILCMKGRMVAMELKTDVGRPTLQQNIHMGRIKNAGGIAGVVRCWGDVVELSKLVGVHVPEE